MLWQSLFFFAVVLANHEVTDDDVEPTLKRQRMEINCQDPSIKVTTISFSVLIQKKPNQVTFLGKIDPLYVIVCI